MFLRELSYSSFKIESVVYVRSFAQERVLIIIDGREVLM